MKSFLFPLLLAALAAAPASAQVHRCTDADGKVTFSDTVCNGDRAQRHFGPIASARGWTAEPTRAPAPTAIASAQLVKTGGAAGR